LPGIAGHITHRLEDLLPVQRQVPPRNVQTGQQQIGAAGGLGQVDDLPDVMGVDPSPVSRMELWSASRPTYAC
jgi:hypothetical protein